MDSVDKGENLWWGSFLGGEKKLAGQLRSQRVVWGRFLGRFVVDGAQNSNDSQRLQQ